MSATDIVQVKRLRTLTELRDRLDALGLTDQLGVDDDVDPGGPLAAPFSFTDGSAGTREVGNRFARQVIETMFDDMDRSLREIGVGDLSVGKKIKKMAQAFYGRAEAYDAGLAEGGALDEAILRNVFGGEGNAAGAAAIASYMRKVDAALAAQDIGMLTVKGPAFPVPEGHAQ